MQNNDSPELTGLDKVDRNPTAQDSTSPTADEDWRHLKQIDFWQIENSLQQPFAVYSQHRMQPAFLQQFPTNTSFNKQS